MAKEEKNKKKSTKKSEAEAKSKQSEKKSNKKSSNKKEASKNKASNKKKSTHAKSDSKKQNTNNKSETKKKEDKKKSSGAKKGAHVNKKNKNLIKTVKDKFIKEKPEPKTNKEKRMMKLEKLRAAKRRKKIAAIVGISAAGLYVVGCILFAFVCFPRTIVADTDLSFQTKNFMKASLVPNAGEYVFTADGLDFELKIDGKDIDYNFDVDQVVDRVIELKNPFAWPYEVFRVHDFMTESVVSFNKEVATNLATPAIQTHNQTATPPANANLICDPNTKDISIKEEVMGNYLDPDKALASVLGYIGSGRRHLECGEDEQMLPTLYADDERCDNAIEQAKVLVESVLTMTMGQAKVATLNLQTWVNWLQLKEGYVAGLNDVMLADWAESLANQCDTLGKKRTFTTPYGKTCTVSGGDNIGWKIDQEALQATVAEQAPLGKIQTLAVPCSAKTNGYAGPGQRDWSARYIDVDLSQQMARMYDDSGNLIWSSAIVSGKPGHNTPTGVYTIKGKKSPTTLIGDIDPATGQPEYESEVQYWMPFKGNSVGLHDASWQPTFGGNWWVEHGSHGCVNLPTGAAASLYGLCVSGDIVVVHN